MLNYGIYLLHKLQDPSNFTKWFYIQARGKWE